MACNDISVSFFVRLMIVTCLLPCNCVHGAPGAILTSSPANLVGTLCQSRGIVMTCLFEDLPNLLWLNNSDFPYARYSYTPGETFPALPTDNKSPNGIMILINNATSIGLEVFSGKSTLNTTALALSREDPQTIECGSLGIRSTPLSVDVRVQERPPPPTFSCFLHSSPAEVFISIKWSSISQQGEESYRVFIDPDSFFCSSDNLPINMDFTCPVNDSAIQYSITISAINTCGESDNNTFTLELRPPAPVASDEVEVEDGVDMIKVQWQEPLEISGSCASVGAINYTLTLNDSTGTAIEETFDSFTICNNGSCSTIISTSHQICSGTIVARNAFGSSAPTPISNVSPRLTTANQVLLALGVLLLCVAISGVGVFLIVMKSRALKPHLMLFLLVCEIVLKVLALILWVAVGFQVGLQDDTCNDGWQNFRDGLIISSFVISLIAFLIFSAICVIATRMTTGMKKKVKNDKKKTWEKVKVVDRELVQNFRCKEKPVNDARVKLQETWYQEDKAEEEQKETNLKENQGRSLKLAKVKEEGETGPGEYYMYSTTEHAKPAGVKAPPASSDYSQLGGGTNSVYSRLNLAGSVQPTGQVEINDTYSTTSHATAQLLKTLPTGTDYSRFGGGNNNEYSVPDHGPRSVPTADPGEMYDTLAKVPCNTMLKRAKVLKGKYGKFDAERMAAWFPYTRKWTSEHLSETKQLKVYFMNVCPENCIFRDPEEIMKFVQGSWANCFIVGEKDSQIRVKFEDTDFSNWTIIGSTSTFLAKEKEPTMSLNFRNMDVKEVKAMVIHQFGHALGMGHALMRPEEWDGIKEYVDVRKMAMSCHDEIDEKAFMRQWTGMGLRTHVQVNHDEKSVMQYCFSTSWLKNVDLVPETVMEKLKQHEQLSITELSDEDKGALKISRAMTVKDLNAMKNKRAEFDLTSELSPMWDTVGLQLEMKKSVLQKFEATEKSKAEKLNMVWTEWLNTDYFPKISFWGNVKEVKYRFTWEGLRFLLTDLGKGELAQEYFEFIYKYS